MLHIHFIQKYEKITKIVLSACSIFSNSSLFTSMLQFTVKQNLTGFHNSTILHHLLYISPLASYILVVHQGGSYKAHITSKKTTFRTSFCFDV